MGLGQKLPRVWRIGDYRFDADARSLSLDERRERLTVKASEVLLRLAEQAGGVVTRERLITEVWDGNAYTGTRGLTYTVWQLRRALDQSADDRPGAASAIETISKSGYRLSLPATQIAAAAVSASLLEIEPATAATVSVADSIRIRRRLVWAVAALALLALLAVGGLLALRSPRAAAPAGPLRALTSLDGVEAFPAYSPDGRRFAYTWQKSGMPARLRIVDPARPDRAPFEFVDPIAPVARPVWVDADHMAYERGLDGDACRVMLLDLRDRSLRELAPCFYQRGFPGLAVSPDGQWLAMARRLPEAASIGIVLHRIADAQQRWLTHPPAGMDDGTVAWAPDGSRLAFLRGTDTVGEVYVVDVASGRETRLTQDQVPVWGLAWAGDSHALFFNAARDGDFAIWKIAADGGGRPQAISRVETAVDLAMIPDGSGDIAAAVHRAADRIDRYDLRSGALLSSISSSGRDMFGEACPDADHPAFVSMRSRGVALWYIDGAGAEARMLAMPAGTPEPPACSPLGGRYATSLRREGAAHDSIVIGSLVAGQVAQVIDQRSSVRALTWAPDGRSLILGSDRSGDWDLWRYEPDTARYTRLTHDQGRFGREVVIAGRNWLYYTRLSVPGLWRRSIAGDGVIGAPESVDAALPIDDWGNWQWFDGALWIVRRSAEHDRLLRLAADGAAQTVLELPTRSIRAYRSLSIDGNGVALLTIAGPAQMDIMRVPVQ
ncbi:winged helix-turn-helix domain-containing protein [Hydrocarboniphaga sp.]|uniref:winged helix-turn-helix domain-containing protein n=1 Tax=Hydrocarboniphaga sp. TaxID=2033016 RepID=UPI003D139584